MVLVIGMCLSLTTLVGKTGINYDNTHLKVLDFTKAGNVITQPTYNFGSKDGGVRTYRREAIKELFVEIKCPVVTED